MPLPSQVPARAASASLRLLLQAFAAASVLLPSGTLSAQDPAKEPRIALLIANSAYQNPKDQLLGPRRDVEKLKRALEAVSFRVTVVQDATQSQLEEAVRAFRRALQAAGPDEAVGVLYYAGHGVADRKRGDNFLLPVDVPSVAAADASAHGVALQQIVDELRLSGEPRALAIVLDACRAGAVGAYAGNAPDRVFDMPDDPDRGYLVAFSTSKGKFAADTGEYAESLAEGLTREGLTIEQVFDEVRRAVVPKTSQLPMFRSALVNSVCMVACKPDASRDVAEKLERLARADEDIKQMLRQQIDTTQAENSDPRWRLREQRTRAVKEVVQRAAGPGGSDQAKRARNDLETGNVKAAESLLRSVEADAAAKRDLPVAARTARQLGGLAATHSVHEATAAFRRAASYEPDNPENWRLAGELWRRGTHLQASVEAYQQLVGILSRKSASAPTDKMLLRDLADANGKLGTVLAQDGDQPNAGLAFQASLSILTRLVADVPGDSPLLDDIAAMQNKLGDALRTMGELPRARDAYTKGLDVYSRLGPSQRLRVSTLLTIAELRRNLGAVYLLERNGETAVKHFRAALQTTERLGESRPGDREVARALALSQRALGFGLVAVGDHAGAKAALDRASVTVRRLVAADPKDMAFRSDLARVLIGLGEAHKGMGDLLSAVGSYNEALGLMSELVMLNPRRILWQQEKLSAILRMADATATYGGRDQAVKAFRNGLVVQGEIWQLIKLKASPRERLSHATGVERVGSSLAAMQDSEGALRAFRASLAMREQALLANPGDNGAEAGIAASCWNIAAMKGHAQVDAAEALDKLQRGKAILHRLAAEGRLPNAFANLEQRFDVAITKATRH